MSRQDPLDVWTAELTKTFPDLSKPQLKGLAEWSFGMILARCCSLDSVASHRGDWLEQPHLTVRSRLREWYLPAERKSISVCGEKRTDLPVRFDSKWRALMQRAGLLRVKGWTNDGSS